MSTLAEILRIPSKKLLTSLFLLVFLFAPTQHNLWAETTVRVGIYQNAPGVFTSQVGQVQGFYIDILNDVAKQADWHLEFVSGTWSEGLQRLEAAQIDILVAMAFSTEREKNYTFTQESVFSNWGQVYVQNTAIKSILDLKNHTIAGLKGDIYTLEFKKLLDDFGIFYAFIETEEYAEAMSLVVNGQADAAIIARSNGLLIEKNFPLHRSQIICCPTDVRFALPKQANQTILTSINRHLAVLKKDKNSFYYAMFNKWFGSVDNNLLPRWLMPVMLGLLAGGLLVFSLVGYIRLRRQIGEKERLLQEEIGTRKTVESRLRITTQVFEHASEAIVITDDKFHIIAINPAFETITGFTKDNALGRNAFDNMDEASDSTDNDQAKWAVLFKTGTWKGILPDKRADGTPYSKQITLSTVQNDEGAITHFIGIFFAVSAPPWRQKSPQ